MSKLDQIVGNEAEAAEHNHNYSLAARHYAALFESEPNDPKLAEALVRNLRHAGQFEEARRVASEALSRVGPTSRLLLEKGKTELGLRRSDLAVQTLQTAVQAAPAEWEPLATLAIALDRQGRYDEAAVQYQAAIDLYPENADTYNNYGLSKALAGRIDDGLAMLRKAVTMPTAGPRIRDNLAFLESLRRSSSTPLGAAGRSAAPELKERLLTEPLPTRKP